MYVCHYNLWLHGIYCEKHCLCYLCQLDAYSAKTLAFSCQQHCYKDRECSKYSNSLMASSRPNKNWNCFSYTRSAPLLIKHITLNSYKQVIYMQQCKYHNMYKQQFSYTLCKQLAKVGGVILALGWWLSEYHIFVFFLLFVCFCCAFRALFNGTQ